MFFSAPVVQREIKINDAEQGASAAGATSAEAQSEGAEDAQTWSLFTV